MDSQAQEALRAVQGYAAAGRIMLTGHAVQRMRERRVTMGDIQHAIAAAKGCMAQSNDRWRVVGPDLDDDELTVVVVIDDGVVVVTTF